MKVYIAAPLRGQSIAEVNRNIQRVIELKGKVARMGHRPLEAHTMALPGCLSPFNPDEDAIGMATALGYVEDADEVWFFGDLTPGMEVEEAHAHFIADRRSRKGGKARPKLRYYPEVTA